MNRTAMLLGCLALISVRAAAEPALPEPDPDLERVPELLDQPPPELPPGAEPLEPEVTIIRREAATIQEYRINGQLYLVKVIPDRGPPYYLADSDGDGTLDVRGDGLEPPGVFQWLLFSW